MASGSRASLNFGEIRVINPTGFHKATIVWLHDLNRSGSESEKTVRSLRNTNIKWICPTAPLRAVTVTTLRTTAWFDLYTKVMDGMPDDLLSLEYVNTYISELLSSEPSHVMKGVGGVGMGAAQALFIASAYAFGKIPIELKIVIGINGWLPNLKNLKDNMEAVFGCHNRAKMLKLLILHRTSDDNILATFAQSSFVNKCADSLRHFDFPTWFKPCGRNAMDEIRTWLLQYGLQP